MSTFHCDDDYNCEYNSFQEHYVTSDITIYDVLDTLNDVSLAFLGLIAVTQFGLMCYNIYTTFSCNKKQAKIQRKVDKLAKLNIPDNKQVKIIRGVSGIGKRSYVYYLESDMNREYVICDINDFFTTNGTYAFNGKNLAEAEANMMSTFITAINNIDKRIYVIGTFERQWMYSNYINIAKLNGYDTYITELDCDNTAELRHFNKRSIHNVPYSKSMKTYTSWETDNTAYKRSPYLSDTDELQSRRYPCLICSDSNSDSDVESDPSIKIPCISNLVDAPQLRERKYLPESEFKDFKKIKIAFNTLKMNTRNTLYTILERTSGSEGTSDEDTSDEDTSDEDTGNSPVESSVLASDNDGGDSIVNTENDLNDLPALLCLEHNMLASVGGIEYMNKYYGTGPWDHLCCACHK